MGEIINEGVRICLGDKKNYFWEDLWIGKMLLKNLFFRLYIIFLDKKKIIFKMGFLDGIN